MVKVITDKRECHCSAFNYCIDENCQRWAEITQNIGPGEGESEDDEMRGVRPRRILTDKPY